MPAVQLARLKSQIQSLLACSSDPPAFQRGLHDLLDLYSNRTYRAGQTLPITALVPSFHVPPIVIRQISLALEAFSQQQPDQALALIDYLWTDSHLEPRQLAAVILGQVALSHADEVQNKLLAWCTPKTERTLVQTLLSSGTARLRSEAPQRLLSLVRGWTELSDPAMQVIGLRALSPLVSDPSFENLPAVFTLLSPMVALPHLNKLQNELSEVMIALTRRSPIETAYFFRQMISLTTSTILQRIARRCLPLMPPAAQATLREMLSDNSRR